MTSNFGATEGYINTNINIGNRILRFTETPKQIRTGLTSPDN